tara:strand:+ start:4973 stop:5212 length:240 start_codon:yes stop_codon:yes gene_type:complete
MYRLDDTNDNYNEAPSATEAMDSSMNFLFENFINPVEDDLSEEQIHILAHIGIAFKIIAEKAQAYEDMVEGNGGDAYRN